MRVCSCRQARISHRASRHWHPSACCQSSAITLPPSFHASLRLTYVRSACPLLLPRRLIEALLDTNTMGGDDVRRIVEQHAARVDLDRRAAEKAAFM